MKLVKMVREIPTKGGVTSLNVQECDIAELKRKGWVVAEESVKQESVQKAAFAEPKVEPKTEQKAEAPKNTLKAKQKSLRDE